MPKRNKNLMIIGAIIFVIIAIVLMKNPQAEEYSRGDICKVNDKNNKYYGKYDISGCVTKKDKSSCIGMTNRNIGDRAVKPCGWNCHECDSKKFRGNDLATRRRKQRCLRENNC